MHGKRKMEIRKKKKKAENIPSGGAWGWRAGWGCLQRRGSICCFRDHRDPLPAVPCGCLGLAQAEVRRWECDKRSQTKSRVSSTCFSLKPHAQRAGLLEWVFQIQ